MCITGRSKNLLIALLSIIALYMTVMISKPSVSGKICFDLNDRMSYRLVVNEKDAPSEVIVTPPNVRNLGNIAVTPPFDKPPRRFTPLSVSKAKLGFTVTPPIARDIEKIAITPPLDENSRRFNLTSVSKERLGFRAGNPDHVPETALDHMLWPTDQKSSSIAEMNAGAPIVMQWRTTQFWQDPFYSHQGKAAFASCLFNNCLTLPMDGNPTHVDAYLFHVAINEKDRMPERRQPWQKYIVIAQESEIRSTFPSYMKDIFNLTVSHRLDADITIPHGAIERKLPSDPTPTPGTNFAANKTGFAAFVVSNCETPSKREVYVKKLQEYISIDTYGKCGTEKWPKPYEECNNKNCGEKKCWKYINKKYKFYLAFENSICIDYVTEKLYRTLYHGGMIPIVLGGADYAARLPKKSYIDVADFESPKELAEYLKILDTNDTLYNEYFQWQYHYKSVQLGSFRCYLCAYLHLNKSAKKILPDFGKWFSPSERCMQPREYYGSYIEA